MPTTEARTFYVGDASNLGKVWSSDARNFKELLEGHFSIATTLPTTRADYEKADKKTRNQLKKSPFVTPSTFHESPSQRDYEHADLVTLICLDIDDPDHARGYYKNPELLAEQLSPFNFIFYSTASSTPSDPRVRILVEADNIPLEFYDGALFTVAKMVGLAEITSESKVQVQPMYLPVIFKDDDPDLEHPLIHFRHDGSAFTEADVDADVANMPTAKRAGKTEFSDAIEFLRQPVEEVTLDVAKIALDHLDPDMPYNDWFKICLALRHQFWGDDADEGFELFDLWSSKGEKYAGEDDCKAKWVSCNPHATSRAPVTIRSLLSQAHEAGWDSSDIIQKCFEKTQGWLERQENSRKLIYDGIRMIAATPLQSSTEEEVLLNVMLTQLKSLGHKAGITTLRQELKKIKSTLKFSGKKKDANPAWTKGIVYVGSRNEFFRHSTKERLSPEALDNSYSRHLMDKGSGDVGSATRPEERPRDLLLNVIQIPEAYDYAYDPRRPNDTIITKNGQRLVNTYLRSHPEPDFSRAVEAGRKIESHLANLVLEPEYREIFLDYLAFLVQRPGKKIRWSPLIQGGHGCGKSFFFEMMKVALGASNVAEVGATALTDSQWNDWAEDSQFVTFEEIRVVGKNRYAVMNKLKPLVSNDTVSINRRFCDGKTIDNITNYMALTNFKDAAALTEGDRRWFIIFSPIQTKSDVQELNALEDGNYFRELFRTLSENPGGVRAYLEKRKISKDFDPSGHAPRTVYFEDMLEATDSDDSAFLNQWLPESDAPFANRYFVSVQDFVTCAEFEGVQIKAQRVANLLANNGYVKAGRRALDGNDKKRTWYFSRDFYKLGEEAWDTIREVVAGAVEVNEVEQML